MLERSTYDAEVIGERISALLEARAIMTVDFVRKCDWTMPRYRQVCENLEGEISRDECEKIARFFNLPVGIIVGTHDITGKPTEQRFIEPAFLITGDAEIGKKLYDKAVELLGKDDRSSIIRWMVKQRPQGIDERQVDQMLAGRAAMKLPWFGLVMRALKGIAQSDRVRELRDEDILGEDVAEAVACLRGQKIPVINGESGSTSTLGGVGGGAGDQAANSATRRLIVGGNLDRIMRARASRFSLEEQSAALASVLGTETITVFRLRVGDQELNEGILSVLCATYGRDRNWWLVLHPNGEIEQEETQRMQTESSTSPSGAEATPINGDILPPESAIHIPPQPRSFIGPDGEWNDNSPEARTCVAHNLNAILEARSRKKTKTRQLDEMNTALGTSSAAQTLRDKTRVLKPAFMQKLATHFDRSLEWWQVQHTLTEVEIEEGLEPSGRILEPVVAGRQLALRGSGTSRGAKGIASCMSGAEVLSILTVKPDILALVRKLKLALGDLNETQQNIVVAAMTELPLSADGLWETIRETGTNLRDLAPPDRTRFLATVLGSLST